MNYKLITALILTLLITLISAISINNLSNIKSKNIKTIIEKINYLKIGNIGDLKIIFNFKKVICSNNTISEIKCELVNPEISGSKNRILFPLVKFKKIFLLIDSNPLELNLSKNSKMSLNLIVDSLTITQNFLMSGLILNKELSLTTAQEIELEDLYREIHSSFKDINISLTIDKTKTVNNISNIKMISKINNNLFSYDSETEGILNLNIDSNITIQLNNQASKSLNLKEKVYKKPKIDFSINYNKEKFSILNRDKFIKTTYNIYKINYITANDKVELNRFILENKEGRKTLYKYEEFIKQMILLAPKLSLNKNAIMFKSILEAMNLTYSNKSTTYSTEIQKIDTDKFNGFYELKMRSIVEKNFSRKKYYIEKEGY